MRVQRFPQPINIIVSVMVVALVIGLTAPVMGTETDDVDKSRPVFRETYDGPPGIPAKAVPGAPRVLPVNFASYSSIQANVGPGGVNIVGDAANEPSIAVDPTHPNRIAIGWRQFATIASSFREAGWAYSTDGGRTWTFPGVIEPGVFRSDPVLEADADGHFFYSSLRYQNPDYWCDIFKSWDGGKTWTHKSYAYGGDKQWITVDRTTGIGRGNVYQAWSIAAGCCTDTTFTRSVDGGIHFEQPVTIPEYPIWGTMAVGAGGELYVAGVDPYQEGRFLVAKSTNALDPGQTPTFDFVTEVNLNGTVYYFGGLATPNPDGLLGQVNIAVDTSNGPNAGNVYLCASVNDFGNDPLDVYFARSTDGGLTFGSPVMLNDDPFITEYQWFATMSVAPNGRIDVIFNDTRIDRVRNLSALYYTSSSDGGLTWSPNQQLSPVFDSHVGWPQQRKLGDYYDMVSDDVGAHLAWAATFNGEQDVYYLRIGDYDCNSNGVADSLDIVNGTSPDVDGNGIPDECEDFSTAANANVNDAYRLYQNVPNPFNPSTVIRYDVPAGGGYVTLRVFDVSGRLVRTLVDQYEMGGDRSIRWDGRNDGGERVATGVYLYRLSTDGYTATRKLILIK
ncbi:MAG: T9SS type A sorting domain-containing protein [Candidatus Latescibacterota bacterium]|nr:MAG: T9SS type A sorting domain-containing protein [Candidatus Latescibacterota bacterium]